MICTHCGANTELKATCGKTYAYKALVLPESDLEAVLSGFGQQGWQVKAILGSWESGDMKVTYTHILMERER